MVEIVATPFLLSDLEHSDAKSRNAMEIASAFITIEEKRNKKAEKLDFISRFYIPFFVVPIDDKRGLPLAESSVFSQSLLIKDMSRIEVFNKELARSKKPGQSQAETYIEYGQKMIAHLRTLASAYNERKRKYKIEGFF
ncbi:MAG: hypothetical protein ACFFBD_27200, partial [Candidatus Hodarchaeota archaeon]